MFVLVSSGLLISIPRMRWDFQLQLKNSNIHPLIIILIWFVPRDPSQEYVYFLSFPTNHHHLLASYTVPRNLDASHHRYLNSTSQPATNPFPHLHFRSSPSLDLTFQFHLSFVSSSFDTLLNSQTSPPLTLGSSISNLTHCLIHSHSHSHLFHPPLTVEHSLTHSITQSSHTPIGHPQTQGRRAGHIIGHFCPG